MRASFFARKSTQQRLARAVAYVILLVGSAVFLVPFLWMVSSSLKEYERIFEPGLHFIPRHKVTIEIGGRLLQTAWYQPPQGERKHVAIMHAVRGVALLRELEGDRLGRAFRAPLRRVQEISVVSPQWRNYLLAWRALPFTTFLRNTIIITLSAVLGQLISTSLVAYAFARLRWPGRDALFIVVLATMMLPGQVTMIPVYLIFRQLHWIDTLLPLIVPAWLGGSAVYIFLLRQFFLTIPLELEEAARIDGASSFAIYWRIMLPLSKPILATIAVFAFIANWNDFMTPLIYLNSTDHMTLALGLRQFQGTYSSDWHLMMAAATAVLAPVLIIFFVAQKQFVRSIVLTGIKG